MPVAVTSYLLAEKYGWTLKLLGPCNFYFPYNFHYASALVIFIDLDQLLKYPKTSRDTSSKRPNEFVCSPNDLLQRKQ